MRASIETTTEMVRSHKSNTRAAEIRSCRPKVGNARNSLFIRGFLARPGPWAAALSRAGAARPGGNDYLSGGEFLASGTVVLRRQVVRDPTVRDSRHWICTNTTRRARIQLSRHANCILFVGESDEKHETREQSDRAVADAWHGQRTAPSGRMVWLRRLRETPGGRRAAAA